MGILANRKILEIAGATILLLATAGLIMYPVETTRAARDGLELCFNVIVPSLFPFFVLSSMIVEMGIAQYLGRLFEPLMRPLFNINGTCGMAFALGFIGGYPTGARTAISIYNKNLCTATEAERLLAFCNNSGPAFILGVVGAGVFSSGKAGLLLYLSHALASVFVGILFRFYGKEKSSRRVRENHQVEAVKFTEAFTKSVVSSFQAMLNISAFVLFFAVAIKMLSVFGIIQTVSDWIGHLTGFMGLDAGKIQRLLTGFLELSSGVWSLRNAAVGMRASLAMAAFMLGWAGISVHCQVLSFIGQSGLNTKTYLVGKILHGLFSAGLAYLFAGLFRFEAPVSSYLVEQLDGLSTMDFTHSLRLSLSASAALLLLAMTYLIYRLLRNRFAPKK